MQLDDFTNSAVALVAELQELRRRVEELEELRKVPALIPKRKFPKWYKHVTQAPEEPITKSQLDRWIQRPEHFEVDWMHRDGRSVYIDAEAFVAWLRRMPASKVRVKGGRR